MVSWENLDFRSHALNEVKQTVETFINSKINGFPLSIYFTFITGQGANYYTWPTRRLVWELLEYIHMCSCDHYLPATFCTVVQCTYGWTYTSILNPKTHYTIRKKWNTSRNTCYYSCVNASRFWSLSGFLPPPCNKAIVGQFQNGCIGEWSLYIC